MTITLRPYQADLIEQTRAQLRAGCRSVLIQAPTGAGKTALMATMLHGAASKGKRCWFIVHRRELVGQAGRAFDQVGVDYSYVAAGFRCNPRATVHVCSIQTLTHRMNLLLDPDLIVWDECHHVAAKGWAAIHKRYSRAVHIGLSATPERLDGAGLSDHFETMVQGPSTRWLIDNGYLAPFKYYAPAAAATASMKIRAGDFAREELQAAMDTSSITGDALGHYLRIARGRRAVAFCVSREHSKHVTAQFNAAGIPAAHVDGETPSAERDETIARFARGELLCLCNVDLFGEGFDLPSLEVAILLRPTQSLALYLQQVGRALRPHPDKEHAVILDHAGNIGRFGMPDEERDWKLDAPKRQKKAGCTVPVRVCPRCFAALPGGTRTCPECQHVFVVESRELEVKEGQLVELPVGRQERIDFTPGPGTNARLDELMQMARQRRYKHPAAWAWHVYQKEQRTPGGTVLAENVNA